MKKTLIIESKLTPVHDTTRDVVLGSYTYMSANAGVELILRCADKYNNAITKDGNHVADTVKVEVVRCGDRKAKLKLTAPKESINIFKNFLYQKSDLSKYFEVK